MAHGRNSTATVRIKDIHKAALREHHEATGETQSDVMYFAAEERLNELVAIYFGKNATKKLHTSNGKVEVAS